MSLNRQSNDFVFHSLRHHQFQFECFLFVFLFTYIVRHLIISDQMFRSVRDKTVDVLHWPCDTRLTLF